MGLCYDTSKWLDRLWGEHIDVSDGAKDAVRAGVDRQGRGFAGFAADLHARLYLPADPAEKDNAPEWAKQLHSQASELGEWNKLRQMCSRNGFAAGIATEALLDALLPLVPQKDGKDGDEGGEGGGQPGQGKPGKGNGPVVPGDGNGEGGEKIRAALRKAARAARDAVKDAEAGLEGMSTPLGLGTPGTAAVMNAGPANLRNLRDAHARMGQSRRLQQIAALAGRLERIAAAKAKSKVKAGVGEIHGIDQGDDLARLLPSELASLRSKRLRLATLAKVVERRAMVYGMRSHETETRGPVVVLVDESGSMGGETDLWAKAVCLALLSTATRQKRAWTLLGFNGAITHEELIEAGKATPAVIEAALNRRCCGGTNFDRPLMRAVEIIKTAQAMKKADVVIITDGEADMEPATVEACAKLTKDEGVSFFAVGVGMCAADGIRSLAPIATSTVCVRNVADGDDPIAPVVNLEAAS